MVAAPLFTVLMPTHSRVDVIEHAIRSVLDQSEVDFELLVVGDGAAPGTESAVAAFADDRVRFVDLPKAPYFGYANRNAALRQSRGRFIAFAADDDLLFPDHLETLARPLKSGAALACSQALWVSTDGIAAPFLTNLENADEMEIFRNVANSIPASCFAYRVDALPERDPWPEDVPAAADWLLWRRIIDLNPRSTVVCRTPTVLHFSALWKKSRHSSMPQFKTLLELSESAEWWPTALRATIPQGVREQEVWAAAMRTAPEVWSTRIRRAAGDVANRLAWDLVCNTAPECGRLRQQLQDAQQINDRLQGELTAVTVARDAARDQAAVSLATHNALQAELAAVTAARDAARNEAAASLAIHNALQAELAAVTAVRDAARDEVAALRSSTSWRITAVLRILAKMVRSRWTFLTPPARP